MAAINDRKNNVMLEELLAEFVKKYDIFLSNDTDIISVCKKLDISVRNYSTRAEGYDGFILITDKFRTIGVDMSLRPEDRRFLIAHELGHFILAESKNEHNLLALKDNLSHGEKKSETENNADYLAAALLVPRGQFIRELDLLSIDYKNLTTEEAVANKISPIFIEFFAKRYRVKEQLILRRIAEVSVYE